MKKLILTIALLVAASVSYAGFLTKDVALPAFNGGKTVALLASHPANIDLRYDEHYSVYCAAASKERTMVGNYSTAARGAYVQSAIPATTWHTQKVNPATPYLNISGCVGQMRRP